MSLVILDVLNGFVDSRCVPEFVMRGYPTLPEELSTPDMVRAIPEDLLHCPWSSFAWADTFLISGRNF